MFRKCPLKGCSSDRPGSEGLRSSVPLLTLRESLPLVGLSLLADLRVSLSDGTGTWILGNVGMFPRSSLSPVLPGDSPHLLCLPSAPSSSCFCFYSPACPCTTGAWKSLSPLLRWPLSASVQRWVGGLVFKAIYRVFTCLSEKKK